MSSNEISLKWNGFQVNMLNNLKSLFYDNGYADVTLVSDGASLKAHKVILSACSPLFSSIFTQNPYKHPIIIIQDVSILALQTLIAFMYNGEVNVTQEFLPEFLKAAESLKIKGLSVAGGDEELQPDLPSSCSPLKRKLSCTDEDLHSVHKNVKTEVSNDLWNDNFQEVIPKTEPQDIWPETIITEGTEEVDSNNLTVFDASGEDNTVDSFNEIKKISDETVNVNASKFKLTNRIHKKKKKSKLKSRNKGACFSTNVIVVDVEKTEETVESGKENMVSESEINDVIQNESTETYDSFINCEPDIDTECRDVISSDKSPKFPCPFCARVYHTWGYRRRHIKTRHRADTPVCKLCSSTCSSQASWLEHVTHKHEVGKGEARRCLLVLAEAHAVLTFAAPTPPALLSDLLLDTIT